MIRCEFCSQPIEFHDVWMHVTEPSVVTGGRKQWRIACHHIPECPPTVATPEGES